MHHSPIRWGESHKTAVTLIKARFLTSIVGNQAGRSQSHHRRRYIVSSILLDRLHMWSLSEGIKSLWSLL